MKTSITTTVLIWICNIVLIVSSVAILMNIYFAVRGFDFFDMESERLRGINELTTMSQTFSGNTYMYQSVYDAESEQRTEHFYYVPGNTVYRFSLKDAPRVTAKTLQEDLSERDWLGFMRLSVFANEAEVPLIMATPGFEITDGDEFNRMFRIGFISIAGYAVFLVILFWFIRRFLIGLKTNSFFTQKNSLNLRITSLMVILAPFLHYLWYLVIERTHEVLLSIEGASLHGSAGYQFKFELLIAGLILIVISGAFDHGLKLQKEQELTI